MRRSFLGQFIPLNLSCPVAITDRTEEVRRLGMGRLLSDISQKMTLKAEKGEDDPMKILIHSTHDTSLSGLLSTLDVYDERCVAVDISNLRSCVERSCSMQVSCVHSSRDV